MKDNTVAILRCFPLLAAVMTTAGYCPAEPSLAGRQLITLDSGKAVVRVDIAGGSIVDFHLPGDTLNPLSWNQPEDGDTKPRTMGHFVCFDRWGQPSPGEGKNGMPYHGEAASVVWTVLAQPSRTVKGTVARMRCELPMGGMTLDRTMTVSERAPVVEVVEEITNINKLGRIYNIVQHPSIAPPFLDESLIVDTNA